MVYKNFVNSSKSIAVLIDPEKCDNGPILLELLKKAEFADRKSVV